MGRNLSLLARTPQLEADGTTHRRDCECARCDAGFHPSEAERAVASRRWEQKKAREAAARAFARRQENDRLKAAEMDLFLEERVRATDDQVKELHDLEERLDTDARLEELWRLRKEGLPLPQALAEVERRFGGAGSH